MSDSGSAPAPSVPDAREVDLARLARHVRRSGCSQCCEAAEVLDKLAARKAKRDAAGVLGEAELWLNGIVGDKDYGNANIRLYAFALLTTLRERAVEGFSPSGATEKAVVCDG